MGKIRQARVLRGCAGVTRTVPDCQGAEISGCVTRATGCLLLLGIACGGAVCCWVGDRRAPGGPGTQRGHRADHDSELGRWGVASIAGPVASRPAITFMGGARGERAEASTKDARCSTRETSRSPPWLPRDRVLGRTTRCHIRTPKPTSPRTGEPSGTIGRLRVGLQQVRGRERRREHGSRVL